MERTALANPATGAEALAHVAGRRELRPWPAERRRRRLLPRPQLGLPASAAFMARVALPLPYSPMMSGWYHIDHPQSTVRGWFGGLSPIPSYIICGVSQQQQQ